MIEVAKAINNSQNSWLGYINEILVVLFRMAPVRYTTYNYQNNHSKFTNLFIFMICAVRFKRKINDDFNL